DDAVADFDALAQRAEHGVELEQVPHRPRVAEVVDRDDLEVAVSLQVRTEEVPADAPEAVDAYARCHLKPPEFARPESSSVPLCPDPVFPRMRGADTR